MHIPCIQHPVNSSELAIALYDYYFKAAYLGQVESIRSCEILTTQPYVEASIESNCCTKNNKIHLTAIKVTVG